MRTLGIDLASQPKKTAACVIEWDTGSARVADLRLDLTNLDIVALAEGCDAIGIDSPFGWPLPFIEFLNQPHAPDMGAMDAASVRSHCFRRTDLHIRERAQPATDECGV